MEATIVFRKLTAVMGVVVIFSLISLLIGTAAFADATGATPDQALAPDGVTRTLAGNSSVWYAFQYSGDQSQITIQLYDQGVAGAVFTVWTPDEVKQMEAGQTVNPVGAGSPNPDLLSNLSWSGNFNMAGTYYVQVSNVNGDAFTYSLTVTGSGVSMPPAPASVAVNAPAPAPTPAAAPAATTSDGSSPALALPITGGSATLNPGASLWFGFQYTGDKSQIQVILNDNGESGLAFGVWTPGEIQQMAAGQTVDPIGRGSPNPDVPADLFWTGNFNQAGTYYVMVQNNSTSAIGFTLAVTGSGTYLLPSGH
jgi:hypothetical protein